MILIHFTKYSAALGAFPSHFFTYANLNLFIHYFKLFANHFCILIKYAPHSNYSGYPCEPKLIATNTTRDYRKNHETGFFSRLIDAMDAAKGKNEPANAVTYVPE